MKQARSQGGGRSKQSDDPLPPQPLKGHFSANGSSVNEYRPSVKQN